MKQRANITFCEIRQNVETLAMLQCVYRNKAL